MAILKLEVKHIKSVKEVVIDEFGDITEIRGDTGQGKTTLLEAIEGGLKGLDASMVRQGAEAGEIMLHLDTVRIHRIIKKDGKDKLTVTDSDGKAIPSARSFLKALFPDSQPFDPLAFVRLGSGDAKGKTDRLRQQRKMLLDAMPARIDKATVTGEVEADVAALLGAVDFDDHALVVASEMEKTVYEARKDVNAAVDRADSELARNPAPDRIPDDAPPVLLDKLNAAKRAVMEAEAKEAASTSTRNRRESVAAAIAKLEAELPPLETVQKAQAEREERAERIDVEIKELRAKLAELEEKREKLRDELSRCRAKQADYDRLAGMRTELAELDAALSGSTVDIDSLRADQERINGEYHNARCAELHSTAKAEYNRLKAKAEALDKAVKFFRDTLPGRIVETMKMPVAGLGIVDGAVVYNGVPLHQLGTSEQLRIAVQLSAALNPKTGFVLIDRAESLGSKDRLALAEIAKELNLQLVLTFVDANAVPSGGVVVMKDGERVK